MVLNCLLPTSAAAHLLEVAQHVATLSQLEEHLRVVGQHGVQLAEGSQSSLAQYRAASGRQKVEHGAQYRAASWMQKAEHGGTVQGSQQEVEG